MDPTVINKESEIGKYYYIVIIRECIEYEYRTETVIGDRAISLFKEV